mgnify:FL=1
MIMHKNLIFIVLLIFLSNCGYSTVYKNNSVSNINIIIVEMNGNREINNRINSRLKKYYSNETENIFRIKMNTILNKEIISKDATGKITNYELQAISSFQINYNKKNVSFTFKEKLNIKNIEDSFEQRKYENVVKNNFASSIQEKLILKLKTIK